MSASYLVDFAQLVCEFDTFGSSSFCDSWQWKLDPYKCFDKCKQACCDIHFRNSSKKESFSELREKIYEVQDGFFLRQVFSLSDGGTLWRYTRKKSNETLLSYCVSRDWTEVVLVEDRTVSGGNMAFEYLCHIFSACGLARDLLTFHGVLLEYDGQGLILSAPSGVGKTTHARLWRDHRHALILNGDRAVVRKINGVWTGFGLPWSGTSGEQINRSVPIRAVIVLTRGEKNLASRLAPLDAFGAVLPNIICPGWDASLTGKSMELLDGFLRKIPVIRLKCRPEQEAVDELARTLEEI